MAAKEAREAVGEYKAGWHDPENATIRFDFGLSEQVVRDISALKDEPDWMTEIRVKAFHHFENRLCPLGEICQCWKKSISIQYVTIFARLMQQKRTGKMYQKIFEIHSIN
ncbi:MAG: hypothetical protein Ct9H90mP23_1870 [Methanobacteriota archaeon]|nr:MAG: hypothetical protein Ct9H90mP23_1870 [Euryarchaeota archaeon]